MFWYMNGTNLIHETKVTYLCKLFSFLPIFLQVYKKWSYIFFATNS